MKRIKRWLVPMMTALIVVVAALSPMYLSQLRDEQFYIVHAEGLEEVSLATWEPTLDERLALLAQWEYDSGSVSYTQREVWNQQITIAGEQKSVRDAVRNELRSLYEDGVIPFEDVLIEVEQQMDLTENGEPSEVEQMEAKALYLTSRASQIGYLIFSLISYAPEVGRILSLSLTIDMESGKAFRVYLYHPMIEWYYIKWKQTGSSCGTAFMNRLGLDYRMRTEDDVSYFAFGSGYDQMVSILSPIDSVLYIDAWNGWETPENISVTFDGSDANTSVEGNEVFDRDDASIPIEEWEFVVKKEPE